MLQTLWFALEIVTFKTKFVLVHFIGKAIFEPGGLMASFRNGEVFLQTLLETKTRRRHPVLSEIRATATKIQVLHLFHAHLKFQIHLSSKDSYSMSRSDENAPLDELMSTEVADYPTLIPDEISSLAARCRDVGNLPFYRLTYWFFSWWDEETIELYALPETLLDHSDEVTIPLKIVFPHNEPGIWGYYDDTILNCFMIHQSKSPPTLEYDNRHIIYCSRELVAEEEAVFRRIMQL